MESDASYGGEGSALLPHLTEGTRAVRLMATVPCAAMPLSRTSPCTRSSS